MQKPGGIIALLDEAWYVLKYKTLMELPFSSISLRYDIVTRQSLKEYLLFTLDILFHVSEMVTWLVILFVVCFRGQHMRLLPRSFIKRLKTINDLASQS